MGFKLHQKLRNINGMYSKLLFFKCTSLFEKHLSYFYQDNCYYIIIIQKTVANMHAVKIAIFVCKYQLGTLSRESENKQVNKTKT